MVPQVVEPASLGAIPVRCPRVRARHMAALSLAALMFSVPILSARAETLRGALRSAYRTNPDIEAERANLRATDESVPQAKSNYRPSLNFEADAGVERTNTVPDSTSEGKTHPRGYTFSANQQLFRGFRTINAVNQAEANIRAGREALRSTEQTVMLAAVTAYMNVVRDQAIVKLRENNVRVLTRNLKATQDRFSVGEVTRTDVAQSQARQAGAVSDLDLARANLRSSRANYQRVIGRVAGNLREPGLPMVFLPKTLKTTISLAQHEHPDVVGALYLEQAARYAVDQVLGELLPTFDIDAQYTHRYSPQLGLQQREVGSVMGTLRVPLYQRGLVSSRVRQAKQLHVRQIQLIHKARKEAQEEAIAAWSQLNAARAQLKSDVAQVQANQIALNGVREEEKVGQRTLLDVLNAEQELLNAQVSEVTDRRNLIVSAYRVIAAVGRLTAHDLRLDTKIYDTTAHYDEVRSKWWGISITHADGRQERFNFLDKNRQAPYKLGQAPVKSGAGGTSNETQAKK
jgi:outer membrane protein